MSVKQLVPVLQMSIGPVILISGVGLLLLSLTNRFGRAADRARQLAKEMRVAAESDQHQVARQIEILFRRAEFIRFSVIMAAISILFASVLIMALFLIALMGVEAGLIIFLLFICCLLSLILSLGAFLRDIHLSLVALKLELEPPRADAE